MGLGKMFGGVGRLGKKVQSKFTRTKKGSSKRTSRLPKASKKSFRKRYPLVKALKLSDNVGGRVLDKLKKYSKDQKHNGAVQLVDTPNIKTDTYSVVVITERALEAAGLNSKSPDLGDIRASISKRLIDAAVLRADRLDGRVCLIPSTNTLQTLEGFKSSAKLKFHWGLFLGTFSDNSLDNRVIMLHTPVTYEQLLSYDDMNPTMSVKNGKMVINPSGHKVGSSDQKPAASSGAGVPPTGPTTPPNAGQSQQNSQGAASPYAKGPVAGQPGQPVAPNADQQNPVQNNQPQQPGQGAARGPVQPGAGTPGQPQAPAQPGAGQQSPVNNQQSQQNRDQPSTDFADMYKQDRPTGAARGPAVGGSIPGGPSAPQPGQPAQPNAQAPKNPGVPQQPTGRPQSRKAPNINPNEPADQPSQPKQAPQRPSKHYANPEDARLAQIKSKLGNKPNQSKQPSDSNEKQKSSDTSDSDDSDETREETNHDPSEPKKNPKEFSSTIKDFTARSYYNDPLNVHIDLPDLKYELRNERPLQFQMGPVRHKRAKLDRMLNDKRTQMNATLRDTRERNVQRILNSALDLLSADADKINSYLDPDNEGSPANKRLVKIKKQYHSTKSLTSSATRSRVQLLEKKYNNRKTQYAQHAAAKARDEFDNMNLHGLSARKDALKKGLTNKSYKHYLSDLKDLDRWRASVGKRALLKIANQIQTNARGVDRASLDDEKAMYESYQQQLSSFEARYYMHEVDRIKAQAYSGNKDRAMQDLTEKTKQKIRHFQNLSKQAHRDARRHMAEAQSNQELRTRALKKNNELLRQQVRQARAAAPERYARTLRMQNASYNELKRERQQDRENFDQDRKSWRAEQKDQTARLNAMNAAVTRLNNRAQNAENQVAQANRNNSSESTWKLLSIAGVVSIIALIGGFGMGHIWSSHSANSHPQTTSQASPGTTIVNGSSEQASPSASNSSSASSSSSSKSSSKADQSNHSKSQQKPKPKANAQTNGLGNAGKGLMKSRPANHGDWYIGTSTSHRPTSYMYVLHHSNYTAGRFITGIKNHGKVRLKITRRFRNMVFVQDTTNGQHYEFNI